MAYDQTLIAAVRTAATALAAAPTTGAPNASVLGNDGRQYNVAAYTGEGAMARIKRDFMANHPPFYGPGIAPPNGGMALICDLSTETLIILRCKK